MVVDEYRTKLFPVTEAAVTITKTASGVTSAPRPLTPTASPAQAGSSQATAQPTSGPAASGAASASDIRLPAVVVVLVCAVVVLLLCNVVSACKLYRQRRGFAPLGRAPDQSAMCLQR